jgi:hypothetical protein
MNRRWRLTGLALAGYLFLLAFYWLAYAYAPAFNQRYLRGEDKLIEWLTFAGFISAAVVLFRIAAGRPRAAGMYLAVLGLFFFVCAGEEISWGQRIFGFGTPHEIKAVNEQHEFNLHNLKLQHVSPLGLVSLFMKVFGIAAPLLAWNRWPRYVPALAVAPSFIFAEALSSIVRALKPRWIELFGAEAANVVRLDTAEFKEMVWGLSCLLAALALRAAWREPCADS